uniref:Uncharacterized protein n=1 Tax=Arundo donax TaxID=35708 RepID=A0A0A9B233_ARUDO
MTSAEQARDRWFQHMGVCVLVQQKYWAANLLLF